MTLFSVSRARRLTAAVALATLPFLPAASAVAALRPVAVPEGVVVGADTPGAIPGRYMVLLKNPGAGVASAESLATGKVDRTYAGIGAFSAHLSPVEARRLAADPAVAMVEQVHRVHIDTYVQTRPIWNLDRIDQHKLPLSKTFTPTDDGRSVHAYVIDTGIRITHLEFGGRARNGYDFVDGDSTAQDCNGHGTHVAGTIGGTRFGVAKKVQLVAVRVLDCAGSGDTETVAAGVDWVTGHAIKPAVANMSLGGDRDSMLDSAVARSIASGVTYTVAAGNDGKNAANYSPADVSTAITVGATDSRDRRASFSNYGSAVDIFAPGVGIWSAYAYKNRNDIIAQLSGTSMASPHVAGAAALVLDAYPAWTPAQVRAYLIRTSTTGRVTKRGTGSPNRLLFVSPPAVVPVVATTALPAAQAGQPYSFQFTVTKPRAGAWRVVSGTLPAGLTLTRSGLLSGTPAADGAATVTVGFTDYVPNSAVRRVTLTVNPA